MKKSLLLLLLQCALVLCGREIPFLATAPVIDGSPGDAVWKKAAYIPRFNSYGEEKSPCQAKVWYGYDRNFFYVLFLCEHGDVKNIAASYTEHDDKVYFDDEVEVFIDSSGRRQDYHQILVNAKGVVFDQYVDKNGRTQIGWNSDVKAVGKILKDSYYVEMAIPLASLNFAENTSGQMGLAFSRVLNYCKDQKFVLGEFHRIGTWTRFNFPVRHGVRLEKFTMPTYGGKHKVEFFIQNLTSKARKLEGFFDKEKVTCLLPPKQTKRLVFNVHHKVGEKTSHRLSLKEGEQELIRFYRLFKPADLLTAFPVSSVIYKGEKLQLKVRIGEKPESALQVEYLSLDGKTLRQKKFPIKGRTATLSLPFDYPEAKVVLSYKGVSSSMIIRSVKGPWQ